MRLTTHSTGVLDSISFMLVFSDDIDAVCSRPVNSGVRLLT